MARILDQLETHSVHYGLLTLPVTNKSVLGPKSRLPFVMHVSGSQIVISTVIETYMKSAPLSIMSNDTQTGVPESQHAASGSPSLGFLLKDLGPTVVLF